MTTLRPTKASKIAFALVGLGLATVSVGATSPDYPDLGRADQLAASAACMRETVDGISVCAVGTDANVSVITVAPGLSVVQ